MPQKRTDFRTKALAVVERIPAGKTLSYKDVARKAGNPRAARAVGAILKTNYNPNIPCHRVIRSDGTPGGYNRGRAQKANKLKAERAIDNSV